MVKTIISTEDDNFMLESYEDLKNELNKKLKLIIKKYEDRKDKRKFVEEKNEIFTEEEYEKSFHIVFGEKEGCKINPESRKQSIEDDFMFNINI